jgi:hypothetical protein
MFVHRWGILRKPIASNIGMKRTTALVMCLSRLHNFCIDSRLGNASAVHEAPVPVVLVPPALLLDEDEVSIAGGLLMPSRAGQNQTVPEALLNGGEHFDDVDRQHLRAAERVAARDGEVLPRDLLHDLVVAKGLVCPPPAAWRRN